MNLKSIFDNFCNKSILIVGDVMIDSYMWGNINRISPEAPVPIVSVTKREDRLGGAANVALNVKALEANPLMCSVVGNDEKGRLFLEITKQMGMNIDGIIVTDNRKTTVKTRIISGTQHTLRVDDEETGFISEDLQNQLWQKVQNIINNQNVDAIVFQDYDKGVLTPSLITQITNLANNKNIPTLVDPKKRNFFEFKNVTLFKPNFKELCEGMKIEISKSDNQAIFEMAQQMIRQNNIKYMMITLSELGVIICSNDKYLQIPAEIRQISDVSGAGDTVVSVAAVCLSSGIDIAEVARISNIAGGLVCEKSGVVPIDKAVLLSESQK